MKSSAAPPTRRTRRKLSQLSATKAARHGDTAVGAGSSQSSGCTHARQAQYHILHTAPLLTCPPPQPALLNCPGRKLSGRVRVRQRHAKCRARGLKRSCRVRATETRAPRRPGRCPPRLPPPARARREKTRLEGQRAAKQDMPACRHGLARLTDEKE